MRGRSAALARATHRAALRSKAPRPTAGIAPRRKMRSALRDEVRRPQSDTEPAGGGDDGRPCEQDRGDRQEHVARFYALASGMGRPESIAHLRGAPWRWENLRFCSPCGHCRSKKGGKIARKVLVFLCVGGDSEPCERSILLRRCGVCALRCSPPLPSPRAALSAQTGGPASPTLTSEAMNQVAFRSLGPA